MFTVFVLALSTGAFVPLVLTSQSLAGSVEGSPITRISWALIYGITILRLVPRRHAVVALLSVNKSLTALVLLAVASVAWSNDPSATLHQSASLLATTLIGIDFTLRYSYIGQMRLICIALGLVVTCSVVAQLFAPGLIPDVNANFETGAWHGVFGAKNDFGRIVVLAVTAFLSLPRQPRWNAALTVLPIVIGFALVLAARSAGAQVILVAVILVFRGSSILRWQPKALKPMVISAVAIASLGSYLALKNLEGVSIMLGRDPTLTGRSDIWKLALSSIEMSPIYGYGYAAFWVPSSEQATRIREEINWDTPHAHNGYIDLALELGMLGLILFLIGYVIAVEQAARYVRKHRGRQAKWPLVFFSLILLYQLQESTIVTGHWILWILYVAVSCSLSRQAISYESSSKLLQFPADRVSPVQEQLFG